MPEPTTADAAASAVRDAAASAGQTAQATAAQANQAAQATAVQAGQALTSATGPAPAPATDVAPAATSADAAPAPATEVEAGTAATPSAGDAAHGGGHHAFDFAGALAHHNMPYPAWEPVHGKPILIFNQPAYAAKNLGALKADAGFASAKPSEAQVAWAKDWIQAKYVAKEAQPPFAHAELAQAMALAQHRSTFGAFPQPLGWVNQQLFFGTVALLVVSVVVFILGRRAAGQVKPASLAQHALEGLVTFIRDDIVRPNMGHGDHHHADRWVAHFSAIFLAVLAFNLFGLIPGTGTASGNIGVTAGLAATTLLTMLFFGIKEQGLGRFLVNLSPVHFSTKPMDLILWPILWVIEALGLLIKPTALAIRLFANMFAGHAVLLSFVALGMIVYASSEKLLGIALALQGVGWVITVALFFLELLVCFVQAYVFTLLSAVYVGSAMHPEH